MASPVTRSMTKNSQLPQNELGEMRDDTSVKPQNELGMRTRNTSCDHDTNSAAGPSISPDDMDADIGLTSNKRHIKPDASCKKKPKSNASDSEETQPSMYEMFRALQVSLQHVMRRLELM